LIFGRYFDKEEVAKISTLLDHPAGAINIGDKEIPGDFAKAKDYFLSHNGVFVLPASDKKMESFGILNDIYGKQAVIYKVENDREIFNQSMTSSRYFPVYVAISSLFFGIFIIFLIDRQVFRRIYNLQTKLREIGKSDELDFRFPVRHNDEISSLTLGVNFLLESIQQLGKKESEGIKQVEAGDRLLRNQNRALDDTKKAVLNILEDSQELQNTLRAERDQSKAIISSMGEGLLVVDKNYELVLINPAAERLLEISADEYLGRDWGDVVTIYEGDKKIPFSEKTVSKTIQSGHAIATTVEDDHYYMTKSGNKFPVVSMTAPLFGGDGGVVGAVKVFRNASREKESRKLIEKEVSDRTVELVKKNEALESAKDQVSRGWHSLEEEHAKLKASIESLPRGFLMVNTKREVLMHNSLIYRMFGIVGEPKRLDDIQSYLGNNFDLVGSINTSIKDKKPQEAKEVIFKEKIIQVFTVPIALAAPETSIIGAVILIEDITEEKLLDRSKDEFFSIASHELRTPLTAIRGNSSLIQQYYKDKLKDKLLIEMIDDIHESSVRLISIVNDFLDLSRLEQKRLEFKKEEFSPEEVVNKALYELESLAKEKKLTLVLAKTADNLPPVLADRDRTEQVIYNLVGNALKFTERGGVSLRILPEGDFIQIAIEDTGKGIPEASRSLLFRKFQQAGQDILTRDNTRGTGLGLYISKLTVEAMGGKIALIKSEVGKGSTFAFTLPIASKQKRITKVSSNIDSKKA